MTRHDDINMETTIGRQVIAKAIKAAFLMIFFFKTKPQKKACFK